MTDETQDIEEVVEDATNVEAEAETEEQAEKPAESSPEKTKVQQRIDELTKARRQAERDAEYWKNQATKQPEPEPEPEEGTKTLADFEYDEGKYAQYIREQARKDAVSEARRILQEGQTQESNRARELSFRNRESEFAEDLKDYNQVTRNQDLTITPQMKDVIVAMDGGPAVLYYLGKNPKIAEKLSYMPPIVAATELGKIEARLEKQKGNSVSNAPPPAPKIEGADSSRPIKADSPDSDKLSADEWLRRRNKQLRGK